MEKGKKDTTKYETEDDKRKREQDRENKKEEKIEEHKEREWISSKKSWIFCKEKVKEDTSVIYEEVGNDIYLLDCKSARLHIWCGEVNAFLTISARNLLKYEKGENAGVKIYYKGIELQTNSNLVGNNFIEYIDIKGDLQRELLNLNRKGFTDKGNKYFDEVINPGLQRSIQNILKALEKDE